MLALKINSLCTISNRCKITKYTYVCVKIIFLRRQQIKICSFDIQTSLSSEMVILYIYISVYKI